MNYSKIISVRFYPNEKPSEPGTRFLVIVHREFPKMEKAYRVSRASYLRLLRYLHNRAGGRL